MAPTHSSVLDCQQPSLKRWKGLAGSGGAPSVMPCMTDEAAIEALIGPHA